MTLNLLTQVPEGIVMLTDSIVSSQRTVGGQLERVNFQHARKLFHLGQTAPAAAMLNGDANIGKLLVSQLLRDASRDIDGHDGPADHQVCLSAVTARISRAYDEFVSTLRSRVAEELTADPAELAKINAKREADRAAPLTTITPEMIGVSGIAQQEPSVIEVTPPWLMVIVGSFFEGPLASLLTWPGAVRRDIISAPGSGLWWWGSGGASLTRLLRGVDFDALMSDDDAEAKAALKYFDTHEDRYTMQSALEIMPVQEAIYFAEYLAQVAAGYDHFKVGPHTVGGEIDVVVLVDGNLKWIHKQRLRSSFNERTRSTLA